MDITDAPDDILFDDGFVMGPRYVLKRESGQWSRLVMRPWATRIITWLVGGGWHASEWRPL